jgi:uncharacterized LabA/DUF88 family protein
MPGRDDRVMIFIDGSNMYHSLKSHFRRTDIDLGKFTKKILDGRRLVRIYYYNAQVGQKEEPERYKDQQKFLSGVEAIPYMELRLGRLVYNNWPGTPPYEKGVDIQLATDMITHSYKKDTDYVGALQAVKDNGKNVEVALFGKGQSSLQLRKVADRVITIDGKLLKGTWK